MSSSDHLQFSSSANDGDEAARNPLYREIVLRFSRQITGGELRPGSKLPTEAQLVAQLGVSKITVRRALQELMRDGLLVGRQGKGVFVNPSPIALSQNILFVHSSTPGEGLSHPYSASLLEGMVEAVRLAFPPIQIGFVGMPPTDEQATDDDTIQSLVTFRRYDGVICMPRIGERAVHYLHQRGVPIVFVGGFPKFDLPKGVVIVDTDRTSDRSFLDLAIDHFLENGRERPGVIMGERIWDFEQMIQKFSAKFAFTPSQVEKGGAGINGGTQAAERLFSRCPDLDSVFVMEDLQALGVMHYLWHKGVQIPKAVAILAQGQNLGPDSHCNLSVIDPRMREIGLEAIRSMTRMLQGQTVSQRIIVSPKLIRRGTT